MAANPLITLNAKNSAELAEAVFRQKERRRRTLAATPIEEKYRQFLQLQCMVADIAQAAGRDSPAVWPILLK